VDRAGYETVARDDRTLVHASADLAASGYIY
jgi:hypothetical protein